MDTARKFRPLLGKLRGRYRRSLDAVLRLQGFDGNYSCWLCRDLKPWRWPLDDVDTGYDTDEATEDDWEPVPPEDFPRSTHDRSLFVAELRTTSPSCPACAVILGLLEQSIPDLDDGRKVRLRASHGKLVISAQEIYNYPSDVFELYRLTPPADRDRVIWPAVRVARSLSPSFSVADASPLIGSWLENCEGNHQECGLDLELPLPTRVIAVEAANDESTPPRDAAGRDGSVRCSQPLLGFAGIPYCQNDQSESVTAEAGDSNAGPAPDICGCRPFVQGARDSLPLDRLSVHHPGRQS
ncbi:hypothetical protein VTG60DRAFT_7071 [Thermothelomyces hinnuleus]